MKNISPCLLLPAMAVAVTCAVRGDEPSEGNAKSPETPSRHIMIRKIQDDDPVEKAPVTFLGVETAPAGPALASQLGLPDGTGLVVTHVVGDSPAGAVLKQNDLLTKFADQILVDSRQLSVLVRSHNEGDEVALTLFRAGKEQVLSVKLGRRVMPVMVGLAGFGPDADGAGPFVNSGDLSDLARLHELPGLAREDVDNVLRMIGREHGNWFSGPRMHVIDHAGGKASTILDLAEGNFVLSDDDGSVEVTAGAGKRELTVKNAKGAVTFKGSINNEKDRQALPPAVLARLNQIENMDVRYEPGEDFEQDATAIQPAQKTKISVPPGLWHNPVGSSGPL